MPTSSAVCCAFNCCPGNPLGHAFNFHCHIRFDISLQVLIPTPENFAALKDLRGILLVNGDFFGQIYGIGGGDQRKSSRVAGLAMINNDYTFRSGGV